MVASSTADAVPLWSNITFVAACLIFAATIIGSFVVKDATVERRLFWWGSMLAILVMAIAALHRGFGLAVAILIAGAGMHTLWAYFYSDYLKIGGKVYNVWSLIRRDR